MPSLMPRFCRRHQADRRCHAAAAAAATALRLRWGVHVQNSNKSEL
jgi:hypothetical protein